jgi:hypothetical protein
MTAYFLSSTLLLVYIRDGKGIEKREISVTSQRDPHYRGVGYVRVCSSKKKNPLCLHNTNVKFLHMKTGAAIKQLSTLTLASSITCFYLIGLFPVKTRSLTKLDHCLFCGSNKAKCV